MAWPRLPGSLDRRLSQVYIARAGCLSAAHGSWAVGATEEVVSVRSRLLVTTEGLRVRVRALAIKADCVCGMKCI